MSVFNHPYLDPSRMERLRRLRIKPGGTAEGSHAGPHRSNYNGSAVEFADYRNYTNGDDIRLVDWKVYGRTDRYYVRLYEEERNMLTYLVTDTSGSMEFKGVEHQTRSKLEHAGYLAAALAFLIIDAGDEAGLSLAGDKLHNHTAPAAGIPHLAGLVDELAGSEAKGKTDLGACLRQLHQRAGRRGIVMILSDFLDPSPSFWQAVELFRRSRFDLFLFHIVHPEELELPNVPLARFTETEGGLGVFNTEPDEVRDLYRERFARFLKQTEAGARQRGCNWYLTRTDGDPIKLLEQCFLAGKTGY